MSCHPVLAEYADPEDVDAALRAYEAAVRRIVEAHGGVVQGFGGDALTAVFGVPTVHEDDAERAVRAGLGLVGPASGLAGAEGGPCEMCVGVHTGEALVQLDVDPARGESFPAGDLLATATHLRSLASATGVVVSEVDAVHSPLRYSSTRSSRFPRRQTRQPPLLSGWRKPGARAPVRNPRAPYPTSLIGRETELAFLKALFEKAAGSASPQVALIVGEPGIGKSRLVAELFGHVQSRADAVTWRQGRCPPYGEGVTFWALGEVFKAHAGVLETDDLASVEAKLDAIVPAGPDREWLLNRLRALLGLEAPPASREENSAAWLRLLEEFASAGPAIVVIEDLHWADEALLAFVEHVAGNVAEVPLLVIATARPELFERQPSFAATIGRVNRIALEPLCLAESECLVAELLEMARVPGEVRDSRRALGGQPLLRRRVGAPAPGPGGRRRVADARQPGGARTTFAGQSGADARLGASRHRGASRHASRRSTRPCSSTPPSSGTSSGPAPWPPWATGMPGSVDGALRDLVARQLVHRVRESSMAGRERVRLRPRPRSRRRLRATPARGSRQEACRRGRMDRRQGRRAQSRTCGEILAHHYVTAVDLAAAAGTRSSRSSLCVPPRSTTLTLAGDRASSLDVADAERHYSRALELAGSDGPERPRLLARWSNAVKQRGRPGEAVAALEEAIAGPRAAVTFAPPRSRR